jgi:hypothetical protein
MKNKLKKIVTGISLELIIVVVFITTACKKDPPVYRLFPNFVLPANSNAETKRIYAAVQNPKYSFGIIDNPGYGTFSTKYPEYDILMSGKTPANISISLNGVPYKAEANGQWCRQAIDLKNYYGKNVTLKVNNSQTFNMYVPKPALVKKIGIPGMAEITRTGNQLTWTKDPNSATGKVVLYYELYDNSEFGSSKGMYYNNIVLLDDNGSYNLDPLISDQKAKKIYFKMVSGNAVSFVINGEKYLFVIDTRDHHEYDIRN